MPDRMIAASGKTGMMVEADGLLFVWTGGMYTDIYFRCDITGQWMITDLCMAMKDMDGEKVIAFGDLPSFIERVQAYREVL